MSESSPTVSPAAVAGDPKQVLRERFQLAEFREGQHAVIERLLAGKNVAAVFPTGGGKSLCYQLPSLMFEGTTVVVSPLIALMKDQCDALAAKGIAAARLDSSLSPAEFRAAARGIRDGSIKLLYVSPERFFNERFLASIGSLRVSLFAIDEAHCISQWGHNFRPDYLKLADLARKLTVERVLALTATATPDVLGDIRAAFDIAAEDAIRTSFHRPNLQLRSSVTSAESQYAELASRLSERPRGPTLVYVSLQRTAEELAERLRSDGYPASAYHAGLDADLRMEIQRRFVDSNDEVIAATIAFGMGIDKANLRYVYHYNPPKSLESYAQEIGRAGRDGEDAICEILLVPDDRVVLENFAYGDTPSRQAVGRFIDFVAGQPERFHLSQYQLSSETDIRVLVVRTLLTYLELKGFIRATSPRYETYKIKPLVDSQTILDRFQGERRQFIAAVLSALTKGRTWYLLNMAVATDRLGRQDAGSHRSDDVRQRIVRALDYLVEQGWIELQATGLEHGYRWLRRFESPKLVADELFDQLQEREAAEIARLDQVFQLARAERCQPATLSAHFGEPLGAACGRCSHCLGEGPWQIPEAGGRSVGSSARRAIEQLARKYPDHFTSPRDRARFLCGLSSPKFAKARLSRDANFGICDRVPFADVLRQLQDA